jgi:hypothetical protein
LSYLALDQSKSRTGWAAWRPGWEKPVVGSVQLGSQFTSRGQTFTKLRSTIIEVFQTVTRFEYLFFEKPINHMMDGGTSEEAILISLGLTGCIEGVGYELRCRQVISYGASSWRPGFCGAGEVEMIKRAAKRAKQSARDPLKAASMERCRQLGIRVGNDDEADSVGILTYGILSKGETPPWIADEVLRTPLGAPA